MTAAVVAVLGVVGWLGWRAGEPGPAVPAPASKGVASAPAGDVEAAARFPAGWRGRWSGPSRVENTGRGPLEFTMELVIEPTDDEKVWSWTVIYDGAAGRQERPYTLVIRDAERGEYAIDEQQGIVIPARLLGGGLYSQFDVQGARITASYRLEGSGAERRLAVEMLTTRADREETSGGKDGIPSVVSRVPLSLQRAELRPVR